MSRLSARDADVARLLAAGFTDKQIRAELGLSQQRVSQIVQHIATVWALDRRRSLRVQIALRFQDAA